MQIVSGLLALCCYKMNKQITFGFSFQNSQSDWLILGAMQWKLVYRFVPLGVSAPPCTPFGDAYTLILTLKMGKLFFYTAFV